jgi:hypothetical protein
MTPVEVAAWTAASRRAQGLGEHAPRPTVDPVEAARARSKARRLARSNVVAAAEATSQNARWGRGFRAMLDRAEQQAAAHLDQVEAARRDAVRRWILARAATVTAPFDPAAYLAGLRQRARAMTDTQRLELARRLGVPREISR